MKLSKRKEERNKCLLLLYIYFHDPKPQNLPRLPIENIRGVSDGSAMVGKCLEYITTAHIFKILFRYHITQIPRGLSHFSTPASKPLSKWFMEFYIHTYYPLYIYGSLLYFEGEKTVLLLGENTNRIQKGRVIN